MCLVQLRKMVYEKPGAILDFLNNSDKKIKNFRRIFHTFQTYLTYKANQQRAFMRHTRTHVLHEKRHRTRRRRREKHIQLMVRLDQFMEIIEMMKRLYL